MSEILTGVPTNTKPIPPESIEELKRLGTELIAWIIKYHDPYTEVTVSWDRISVKHEGVGIPVPYLEK